MKRINIAVYRPYLIRVASMTLTLFLLVQLWIPAVRADNVLPNAASPVIYLRGTPVYDGMKISRNDLLYPRYLFKSTRSELAGLEATIPLPEHLRAAYAMSGTISGTDSNDDGLDVGTLTIDEDGNVKVSFFSSLDGTGLESSDDNEPATDGVTEDDNPATAGVIEDESSATDGNTQNGNPGREEAIEEENPATDGNTQNGNPGRGEAIEEENPPTEEVTEDNSPAADDGAGALDDGDGLGAPEVNEADNPAAFIANESSDPDEDVGEPESGGDETLPYIFMPRIGDPAMKQFFAAAIDPDEEITVDFIIPTMLDVSGLKANDDGSYSVTLLSGGREVTVTLVAQAMPMAAGARAATLGTTLFEKAVTITNIELLDANGNEFATPATVGKNNTMQLRYAFTMSEEEIEAIKAAITAGITKFSVPIPANLTLGTRTEEISLQLTAEIDIGGGTMRTIQYGVLNISFASPTTAEVIFGGAFWSELSLNNPYNYTNVSSFEGGFEFGCKLDNIGTGNVDVKLIRESIEYTMTLNVVEDAMPGAITKKGTYNNTTNIIDWTVTYTTGTIARNLPITFTDTFDSTYQQFVSNSFKVQYATSADTKKVYDSGLAFATVGTTDTTRQIKYVINASSGITGMPTDTIPVKTAITFTYQTEVTPDYYASTDTGVSSLKNTAKISPSDDHVSPVTVDATPTPAPNKQWVSKSGTADDIKDGIINWAVVVDTQKLSIENLKFYDLIADGLTVVGDVTVNNVVVGTSGSTATYQCLSYNKSADSTSPDNTSIPAPVLLHDTPEGPTILKIDLNQFVGSDSYERLYTIRYSTKVDDKHYIGNFNPTFINTAWIDFTWPDDTTRDKIPAQYITGKSTNVGPGNTQLITKSGVFDEGASEIEWTITVNPHHVNVSTGVVTDTLLYPLEYIYTSTSGVTLTRTATNGSTTIATATAPTTDPLTWVGETFTYQVEDLGTDTVSIKFKTKVNMAAYKQAGTNLINYTARNGARFEGTVDFEGVPTAVLDTYTASVSIPVRWVSKAVSGTYDYKNKTAEWLITVNGGKADMTGVTLYDTLPSYMTPVNLNDAIVVSNTKANALNGVPNYTLGTHYKVEWIINPATTTTPTQIKDTLKISFIDNTCDNSTVYVRIKTKVDVDALDALKNGSASATIANPTARVTFTTDSTDGNEATSGAATQKISNQMISKAHTNNGYHEEDNTIAYEVKVNPVQLNLTNCQLIDSIPPELRLDITSVKLYNASVVATGGITTAYKEASGYTWNYDVATNQLIVDLPKISPPNVAQAYVLSYKCQVINFKASIKNTIALTGLYETSSYTGSDTFSLNASAWARGVVKAAAIGLKIIKQEAGTSATISGITFKLYTMSSDGVKRYLDTQTTNSKGELLFAGLSLNGKYELEELSDPSLRYNYKTAKVKITGGTLPLSRYNYTPTASQIDTIYITNELIPQAQPQPTPAPAPTPTPYTPQPRSRGGGGGSPTITPTPTPVVTPTTPETPPPPPPSQPFQPGNTLVPSETEENVYIEIDSNGVPVGRWRQVPDENGELVWIFEEDPPLARFPDTGDARSDKLFLWILCFYISNAVMIAMIWIKHKRKRW